MKYMRSVCKGYFTSKQPLEKLYKAKVDSTLGVVKVKNWKADSTFGLIKLKIGRMDSPLGQCHCHLGLAEVNKNVKNQMLIPNRF